MKTLHLTDPLTHNKNCLMVGDLLIAKGYLNKTHRNDIFGPHKAKACIEAKKDLGYPTKECLPCAGDLLVSFLNGKVKDKKLLAEYKARAARRKRAEKAANDPITHLRAEIVKVAMWGVTNEPKIHYRQSRPIDGINTLWKLPLYTDCSGFVTLCYKWAGAPKDPNDNNYNGLGYTGTLIAHGRTVTAATAKPGDLVIYGPASATHHTCIVVKADAGGNPLLVSHGQEGGPDLIYHLTEQQYQPRPATFKNYLD